MQESLFIKKLIECPFCLNEEEATVWQVIDATADPDLKDKLLRKELQAQQCSNCGQTFILARPLLYRDSGRKILYYCHPGQSEEAARAFLNGQAGLPGWQLRLTGDYNQLIEKIHISDHHCDDRLIELIKLAAVRRDGRGAELASLFFLTANAQTFRFMAAGADGTWQSLDLESKIYLNAEQLAAGRLADDCGQWLVIGQTYAAQLLRELAAE